VRSNCELHAKINTREYSVHGAPEGGYYKRLSIGKKFHQKVKPFCQAQLQGFAGIFIFNLDSRNGNAPASARAPATVDLNRE
jgi:hypothetical protein